MSEERWSRVAIIAALDRAKPGDGIGVPESRAGINRDQFYHGLIVRGGACTIADVRIVADDTMPFRLGESPHLYPGMTDEETGFLICPNDGVVGTFKRAGRFLRCVPLEAVEQAKGKTKKGKTDETK